MDITTANRLYELRKQHGYSQDELADKLNVSRQAISKWERSESSPDTDNLIALARLYGVSLDELLNYTPASASADTKDTDAQTTDGNSENNGQNAQSTVNNDKTDTKTFGSDSNSDRVHIDENGIYVHDKDGSDVVINGGIAKLVNKVVGTIHIEDGKKTTINGKDVNDGEYVENGSAVHIKNGHITFDNQKSKNVAIASSVVNGVTFLLCTVSYLLIGFLCRDRHFNLDCRLAHEPVQNCEIRHRKLAGRFGCIQRNRADLTRKHSCTGQFLKCASRILIECNIRLCGDLIRRAAGAIFFCTRIRTVQFHRICAQLHLIGRSTSTAAADQHAGQRDCCSRSCCALHKGTPGHFFCHNIALL